MSRVERVGLTLKNLNQVVKHLRTIGSGSAVEPDAVIGRSVLGPDDSPQLHGHLGRQGNEVVGEVLHLVIGEVTVVTLGSIDLVDHGSVLIHAPVGSQLDATVIEKVLDSDLTLVVLNEVVEGNSGLKPDESGSQLVDDRAIGLEVIAGQEPTSNKALVQTVPRPAGRGR